MSVRDMVKSRRENMDRWIEDRLCTPVSLKDRVVGGDNLKPGTPGWLGGHRRRRRVVLDPRRWRKVVVGGD